MKHEKKKMLYTKPVVFFAWFMKAASTQAALHYTDKSQSSITNAENIQRNHLEYITRNHFQLKHAWSMKREKGYEQVFYSW